MDKTNCTESPGQTIVAPPEGRAFWQSKTLAELASEQGVAPLTDFDALFGKGKEFWADDAEFDAFLVGLRESRRLPAE
jgi:hypothetical protein